MLCRKCIKRSELLAIRLIVHLVSQLNHHSADDHRRSWTTVVPGSHAVCVQNWHGTCTAVPPSSTLSLRTMSGYAVIISISRGEHLPVCRRMAVIARVRCRRRQLQCVASVSAETRYTQFEVIRFIVDHKRPVLGREPKSIRLKNLEQKQCQWQV